jgi:uncharacterized membrane protein YgdD (TMEM256/DUF423 family)
VAAGAFAAHGLADVQARDWAKTGSTYEAVHALAALACATLGGRSARAARWAAAFFLGGSILFSGSLYAMAFGGPHWLGIVTPIGGVGFILGWGLLTVAGSGMDTPPRS